MRIRISPITLRDAVKKCKTQDEVFAILKNVEPFCIKYAETYLGHSSLVADGAKGEVRIIDDVSIAPERNVRSPMVGKDVEVILEREHDSLQPEPYPYNPDGNYKNTLARSSKQTIIPEYFYIKKNICGASVSILLGRIGFSEQAIKKIGFDPVKYIQDQNNRISKLTTACNQMKQQLEEIALEKDDIELALKETRKPLMKKFFNFITGKIEGDQCNGGS